MANKLTTKSTKISKSMEIITIFMAKTKEIKEIKKMAMGVAMEIKGILLFLI